MQQTVTVTRAADRHGELHERCFADTFAATVPAGPPADVVARALDGRDLPEGSYVIVVDWPHE